MMEVIQLHHFEFQAEFKIVKCDIRGLKDDVSVLKSDVGSLKEQVAFLHEGQTEIKNSLKLKVDRDEFFGLEMRVARLENKVA